jgi:ABC-type glycerol-3-phosphate transport system substrate-binding protein
MGDMPIVIAGYGLYNELQVFAPELRGKWGFSLVPGTRREDGTIDRSAPTSVGQSGSQTGSMILADSDQIAEAWEFLKWWTSTETQIEFGRQIESVLGVAGRYATANVEALAGLPWSVDEYERLMAQWRWIRGVPEVPGGYVIGRYLDNAFRQVVYNNKPARDVLVDYNRLINEEIERKRIEFGLPTTVEELPPEHRRLYWVEQ